MTPSGGAQDLAQSYLFRPLPGQPGHQTSIPNLYTLGAATWPGSGVSGSSGYIAAQKLLRSPTRAPTEAAARPDFEPWCS